MFGASVRPLVPVAPGGVLPPAVPSLAPVLTQARCSHPDAQSSSSGAGKGTPPSSASACCYVHLGSGKSLTKQDRPWHNSSLCWVRGASNNSHLREDVSMQQVPKVFPSEGSEASLPLAATGFLSRGCRHALLSCWRFSSPRSSAPGAGVSPQQMLRSQRVAEATLTGGP